MTIDISTIPDIQNTPDTRNMAIDKVGIKGLRHPIRLQSKNGNVQATVADIMMAVDLPVHVKGTHMSRFLQILHEHEDVFSLTNFAELLYATTERLESSNAYVEMSFPFFVNKTAPISGVKSFLDYDVTLLGSYKNGTTKIQVKLIIPITSLCPCSKKISKYGAHNQRSHVTITADITGDISFEDIIIIAEKEASCELYGVLKRPDEKHVTERAYENPKFVEDLVRDIAKHLNEEERIGAYTLECENFESIHNHSAYAVIEST